VVEAAPMTDQTAEKEGVKGTWARGWALLNELAVHTLVVIVVLASIELIELTIKWARHGEDIVFFKDSRFQFPGKWLFDTADIAMIAVVLALGVWFLIKVYLGERK
jgi:hypothetical protein